MTNPAGSVALQEVVTIVLPEIGRSVPREAETIAEADATIAVVAEADATITVTAEVTIAVIRTSLLWKTSTQKMKSRFGRLAGWRVSLV